MEASSIFNMLDPLNKGELHIKQINDLLLKVDKLGIEPEIIPPIETVDKKPDTDLQGSQRESQRFIITKTSRKNTIRKKSVIKAQSEVQMPKMYRNSSLPNSPRLDKEEPLVRPESPVKIETGSFQYNSFSNRKKLIRRDEFTTLYEGNLVHQSIQDEVLLKCFSAFDYDK